MSLLVGALLVLSHLAVVIGGILVAMDPTHAGKWGVFAALLVFAILVSVVFRMMGHRILDVYDFLSVFHW